MAGSNPTDQRPGIGWGGALGTLGVTLMLASCAGGGVPEPQSLPPQTVTDTRIEEPAESEPPVAAAVKDDTVMVIDEGVPSSQPSTLAEAATAERDRRTEAGESEIRITNENLDDYAGGSLTFSDGPQDDPAEATVDPEIAEFLSTEEHWREQVREARVRWKTAADQIDDLEVEIAGLRRRFYAEDDPFYRDSQIKPAWDRSLVELDAARVEVEEAQEDLARVLEEGRRAGALPGWLREGIELEPEVEDDADDALSPAEPREPDVIDG